MSDYCCCRLVADRPIFISLLLVVGVLDWEFLGTHQNVEEMSASLETLGKPGKKVIFDFGTKCLGWQCKTLVDW